MLRNLLIALLAVVPAAAGANDYRGMPAGWPASNVGVPAVPVTAGYAPAGAYGLYQANRPSYAAPLAYYAARPVQAVSAAYYTPTPGMAPTYSQVNYTQPVAAYYAPQGYAPQAGYAASPVITAYSPGAAAGMAPAYGISPQPGTMLQPQRVYYGTAGSLSFAPPAAPVMYRSYYAPAGGAVTYYRPVTVYQPATGQPVTCLQAVQPVQTCGTASCAPAGCGSGGCGPTGCSRGWNLFSWLCPRGCGPSGCGTTCGTASCAPTGCGQQPYYPVTPVIPVTPTIPVVPAPTTTTPPFTGVPRIPPPPTRIITPGGAADVPPSLSPGTLPSTGSTIVTPVPGSTYTTPGTITPGTTIQPGVTSPAPGSPYTPGSPGTALPATEYYPPPMPESSRFAPPANSGIGTGASNGSSGSTNALRFSPPANSSTPNGVKVVPDPDAPTFKPTNRAPQLIDPRDRSAALGNPWAVVPAVWPTKQRSVAATAPRQIRQPSSTGGRVVQATSANASRQLNERTDFAPTSAFVPQAEESLDDSGWASGR